MELETGDGRVLQLAIVADLGNEAADFVVLFDGFHQCIIGNIDAEVLVDVVQNVALQLFLIVLQAVLILFERNVSEIAEEVRIVNDVHHLEMLLHTGGGSTGFCCHLCIQEVIAALQCPLQQAAAIKTGTTRHVVGRHIRGCAVRCSQTNADTSGDIEKNFRHGIASIT